ncbi:hypothetical protein G6F56_014247 [Rhizopus delemar]|nr:hypothetical protein G6F56_014247 [Rhizopus delemar]
MLHTAPPPVNAGTGLTPPAIAGGRGSSSVGFDARLAQPASRPASRAAMTMGRTVMVDSCSDRAASVGRATCAGDDRGRST